MQVQEDESSHTYCEDAQSVPLFQAGHTFLRVLVYYKYLVPVQSITVPWEVLYRYKVPGTYIIGEIPKTLNNFAVFNHTNDFTIYRNQFYNIT